VRLVEARKTTRGVDGIVDDQALAKHLERGLNDFLAGRRVHLQLLVQVETSDHETDSSRPETGAT